MRGRRAQDVAVGNVLFANIFFERLSFSQLTES